MYVEEAFPPMLLRYLTFFFSPTYPPALSVNWMNEKMCWWVMSDAVKLLAAASSHSDVLIIFKKLIWLVQ